MGESRKGRSACVPQQVTAFTLKLICVPVVQKKALPRARSVITYDCDTMSLAIALGRDPQSHFLFLRDLASYQHLCDGKARGRVCQVEW